MSRLEGTLVLPSGPARGVIEFASSITRLDLLGPARASADGPYVLPGFIDSHVHGGAGFDTMDGADAVRGLCHFHLSRGTTTLLPTTVTNPWPRVLAALRAVAEVAAEPEPSTWPMPSVPGVHLEGPFISPLRLGAQPPHALEPTPELVDAALATGVLRVVTLAPELPGVLEAAARLARAGVRISVGHTLASAEQVQRLAQVVRAEGGTLGFTHLYNAMSQLTGREPGTVGAALADAEAYAELILDLHHVHGASFLAAWRAKRERARLLLVTDAIRACGLGDGVSELGGQAVTVAGGVVRLADGTLAGSVLTMDQAVRNAVGLGIDLAEASRLASAVPASYLGLTDRGVLEVGSRADLVVLDSDLAVSRVLVAGREVPSAGG